MTERRDVRVQGFFFVHLFYLLLTVAFVLLKGCEVPLRWEYDGHPHSFRFTSGEKR